VCAWVKLLHTLCCRLTG